MWVDLVGVIVWIDVVVVVVLVSIDVSRFVVGRSVVLAGGVVSGLDLWFDLETL